MKVTCLNTSCFATYENEIFNWTASKRSIQKTVEATGDLIGNKIADKITSITKKPAKELHNNDEAEENVEITAHKKRYASPEGRQQIIAKLRVIPKSYWWTYINTIVCV